MSITADHRKAHLMGQTEAGTVTIMPAASSTGQEEAVPPMWPQNLMVLARTVPAGRPMRTASSGGGGGWFGGNYGLRGESGAGGSGYVDGVAPFTHNGKYYPAETEAGVNEGNGRAFIRYVECA